MGQERTIDNGRFVILSENQNGAGTTVYRVKLADGFDPLASDIHTLKLKLRGAFGVHVEGPKRYGTGGLGWMWEVRAYDD